jgi:YD repeat-containing protein
MRRMLGGVGAGQAERHSYSDKTLHNTVLGITERKSSSGSVYRYARDEQGGLVSQRGTTSGFFLFDALGSVTGLTERLSDVLCVSLRRLVDGRGRRQPGNRSPKSILSSARARSIISASSSTGSCCFAHPYHRE